MPDLQYKLLQMRRNYKAFRDMELQNIDKR